MGHIVKQEKSSGKIRYYARYKTPSGRWRWECGGSRKKDAEALLRARESQIAAGTYGKLEDSPISFKEYVSMFLSNSRGRVKPSTYDDYEGVLRNHLVTAIGNKRLRDITSADCKDAINEKKEELAPRTVNKCIMLLKLVLSEAMEDGYIQSNPAQNIKRLKVQHEEMDFLEPTEVQRLLAACQPDFYPVVATAVMTGLRQGEQIALTWGDIDLGRGVIFVRRSFHPKHGVASTKTSRSARAVSISPELVNILRSLKELGDGESDSLVFPGKGGTLMMPQNMIRDEFWPTLERAGVKRIRWHDLRHTYASLMISMGESVRFVSQQLGHTSTRTTWDIYSHLLPEVSENAGRKIDNALFSEKVVHFPARQAGS